MNRRSVSLGLCIAALWMLGGNSQAGVVTNNSYFDTQREFVWQFVWTGAAPGGNEDLVAVGQEEWQGVRLRLTANKRLSVYATHVIPEHGEGPNTKELRIENLDVSNLAFNTQPQLILGGNAFDAEPHKGHSDWMYITYERPFNQDTVQFRVNGDHRGVHVPEPTSGLVIAGLFGVSAILRIRRKRLAA